MKLISARVRQFQSVIDSEEFEVDDITCLVGKNESGKTAILKALYNLNPVVPAEDSFQEDVDYPRKYLNTFKMNEGQIFNNIVVEAKFEFNNSEIEKLENQFGKNSIIITKNVITLQKGYDNILYFSGIEINESIMFDHFVDQIEFHEDVKSDLQQERSWELLNSHTAGYNTDSDEQAAIKETILKTASFENIKSAILNEICLKYIPKFMYFDEYYQINGQENLNELQGRIESNNLKNSDHPLLGLFELADLKIEELLYPNTIERRFNSFEMASILATSKVFDHWSQNKFLEIKFEKEVVQSNDQFELNPGVNLFIRIEDTRDKFSTSLGNRSRGFLWFFSFLTWYKKLCKDHKNLILLLDEPGLSLHASAQSDLLNFFETEFNHQIIYTTHSPFMINPVKFNGVRIVQNNSIENESLRNSGIQDAANYEIDSEDGTKVTSDIYKAGRDTIFPLQGALGYDITQSLFVGPNCLIVEGLSDWHYLDCLSSYLQEKGEVGLSADWTITPVGGLGNVSTFVSLLCSQVGLNISVLLDYRKNDRQKINNLYKENILRRSNLILYSDYIEKLNEADVEDMFQPNFYLRLLNDTFSTSIKVKDLQPKNRPIISRLDHLAKQNSIIHSQLSYNQNSFNHNRPAKYFASNFDEIKTRLQDTELDRFRKLFESINSLL